LFSPLEIVFTVVCYVFALFVLAQIAERNHANGGQWTQSPVVYALGLGVYCTTWTFYGSVGNASGNGMLWVTIYLGPTLSLMLAPTLLRRMVLLKHVHRITSIADFISARYAKSQAVAALVTSMLLVGIVPYIALQLKAVTGTFELITQSAEGTDASKLMSPIVVALMILFTIMFGIRRLDPTERHPGMMVSLAAESLVKLVAFLAAGIFVVITIFGDVGGFLDKLDAGFPKPVILLGEASGTQLLTWFVYLLLATFAFMLLPRQFHVAVIENSDDRQIKTAMWLTPTYLLIINLCVLPIALAGMLVPPGTTPDQFVLSLPMAAGQKALSLVVFIGGFSAAIGMIMVETTTMATMVGNHLILPVIEANESLWGFRRHLLYARWFAATVLIFISYGFEVGIGKSAMLVSIGMLSFAAVTQFAPAIIGGLFWSRASRGGALLGLSIAFAMWTYTLFLPTFVRSGWLSESLLAEGPFGIGALRPEALLGVSGVTGLAHGTLWTTGLNIVGFIVGSLLFPADATERRIADEFLAAAERTDQLDRGEAIIPLDDKRDALVELLTRYYPHAEAEALVGRVLEENKLTYKENITPLELTELHTSVERLLAGALGAASAHQAIGHLRAQTTSDESKALEKVYTRLLANLQMAPSELRRRIDFMTEREALLKHQAQELQARVDARTRELQAAQKELLETAHQAVRAEIATNVLHDVDNVLNSINVSVTASMEMIATSQIAMLPSVTKTLDDHRTHLGDFLTKDEKGKQLPVFLDKLVQHLMKERERFAIELRRINKGVDHIKSIVTQQSYAGVSAVWEPVQLEEIIEDAIRANAGGIDRYDVTIVREFESLPPQMIQKHKVLQILVNLVSNAKHAVMARSAGGGTVTLALSAVDGKAQISCSDNCVGSSTESFDRLFRQGFTTKTNSHGFGLQSAVLAAREMGGDLTSSSKGEGKGTTLVLTLPLSPVRWEGA